MKNSRDIGLDHGAGKGDKSRVTNTKAYRDNHAAIDWKNARRNRDLYPIILDCDKCGKSVNLKDSVSAPGYSILCPDCVVFIEERRHNEDPI